MAQRVPFSRLVLAKSGAFSSEDYPRKPVSNEEILWRSVIDRAIHDLGSKDSTIRHDAEEWMDILNEDFVEICRLANVLPKEVFDFVDKYASILLYNPEPITIYDITIYFKIKKRTLHYGS